jgi:hypothetical protein
MLMPEELRAAHRAGFDRFVRTGKAQLVGRRWRSRVFVPTGTRFPMELSLGSAGEGAARTLTAVIRDLSDRRRQERHLAAQLAVTSVLAPRTRPRGGRAHRRGAHAGARVGRRGVVDRRPRGGRDARAPPPLAGRRGAHAGFAEATSGLARNPSAGHPPGDARARDAGLARRPLAAAGLHPSCRAAQCGCARDLVAPADRRPPDRRHRVLHARAAARSTATCATC